MTSSYVIERANRLIQKFHTRNPEELAEALNIHIMLQAFREQKGAYTVIERNRYIFLNQNLGSVMRGIVICHEIGHDQLHRDLLTNGVLYEGFNLYDMQNKIMEYEANLFAAQILLPDEDILDCVNMGYNVAQTAKALRSDINLVALKIAEMKNRGHAFHEQDCRGDFLRG